MSFINSKKDYKVWCDTKQEVEEVLNALEANNITWVLDHAPATSFFRWHYRTDYAPIGFHIDTDIRGNQCISYSDTRLAFDNEKGEIELSVSDILKASSHTVFEPTIGNLLDLFNESIL